MEIKPNNIYLGDCYKLIKDIPDKSIDLIYTDIPYSFVGNGLNGGGGAFGTRKRDYHGEYAKVSKNTNASALHKRRSSSSSSLQEIAYGIDFSILDEFCRVLKNIYIYGAVKYKYCHCLIISSIKKVASMKFFFGARQTQYQPQTALI